MRTIISLLVCLCFASSVFNPAEAASQCRFDPFKADFIDPNAFEKMASIYQNWVINPNTNGSVRVSRARGTDRIYPLSIKGLTITKFLHYEENKYGINVGWTDDASSKTEKANRKWRIQRSDNSRGPLRYGEKIAIGWIENNSFIRYKARKWGINLDWSKKPVYEWQVLGGKEKTEVRPRSNRVIIYNMKHRYPLIYVSRKRGGHIGWPNSTKGWDTGKNCTKKHGVIAARVLAKDRNPARQ